MCVERRYDMYENQVMVRFDEAYELEEFVKAASDCDFHIDVKYRNSLIDAKSILGMIAIGLRNNIIVCYGGENPAFESVVSKYAIA